ncbi:MAG: HPF/RaiA family ribosome-associated protein [Ferruginibacter sp.]
MITTIQSIGFTASEALTTFIKEKTAKMGLHLESILSSEVCLSTDKSSTNENKVCDIRLIIPGNDLLAKSQCKTFEEATAHACDALIKQIEKHKTKILNQRNHAGAIE